MREVTREHLDILAAVEAGDAVKARRAASRHMNNAIKRIRQADSSFWTQEGETLARSLVGQPDLQRTPSR